MSMRTTKALALVLLAVVLAWPLSAVAAPGDPAEPVDLSWTRNYTLFLSSAATVDQMYEAKAAVEAAGGRVGVIIPFGVMLGWIDADKAASVVGKGGVRAVHQRALASTPAGLTREEADGVKFFNRVASGDYAKARTQVAATAKQGKILPDNFEAPKISFADVVKNLEAQGLTVEGLAAKGIVLNEGPDGELSGPTNSQYMAGTVLFNAVFVESVGGAGGDPNVYTWTAAAHTAIFSEITSGLSWWANQAATAPYKVPLTFVYVDRYNVAAVTTKYEPIRHASSQDSLWISEIMGKFGFAAGDKFARTAAFNAWARNAYNTNWSVVSFVGYNPSPAPSTFTDGYFAYTWSTYTQLLYRNNGWGTTQYDIVNAHETGHIFGTSDEYYQAGYGGCTSCGVAGNGVLNGNCEYCNTNSQPCMMRGNTLALCGYTPGQLGWTNLRSMTASTATWAGATKYFYAPGEKIQVRASYCVGGPRLGTRTQAVKARFVARYFTGALFGGTAPAVSDTGWLAAGSLTLPTLGGQSCYTTWANVRVPAGVAWGAASIDAMIDVAEIGRGHATGTNKFYVTGGATPIEDGAPLPGVALFEEDVEPEAGTIQH